MKKRVLIGGISAVVLMVMIALVRYIIPFPIAPKSIGFELTVSIFAAVCLLVYAFIDFYDEYTAEKVIYGALMCLGFLVIICISIPGLNLFSSKEKASIMSEIEEVTFDEIVSGVTFDNIQIVDTTSAKQYGARTLGSCSDAKVLSQNMVSNDYSSIVVNGTPLKVAPLEYSGFFKAWSGNGIYGYVKVSPIAENVTAEYVKTEPFTYSPSAMWGHDLKRHIQFQYPYTFFENSHLEITDDEKIKWVSTTYKYACGLSGKTVTGIIVTDPYTGESEAYGINEIPEWVDIVYSGKYVSQVYNWYGLLSGGWKNSWTNQINCTETTDDFGYLAIGNDMYMYTGITSVTTNDESNIGFLLVNLRNFESKMFKLAGAEEYSAMKAAEQEVANYGYKASFPSLMSIEGFPTYVMVLKDDNGLIKRYAMVNISKYDVVAVGNTLEETKNQYCYLMGVADMSEASMPQQPEEVVTEVETETVDVSNMVNIQITVVKKETIVMDGNTYLYVADTNGNIYHARYTDVINMMFVDEGMSIAIKVAPDGTFVY